MNLLNDWPFSSFLSFIFIISYAIYKLIQKGIKHYQFVNSIIGSFPYKMGSLSKLLKKLDMNPSTEDSFKERTLTGALSIKLFIIYYVVSVITIILMGSLFWGEFKLYITNVITFNCFLYCSKE